jgi:hypothetical protein
MRMSALTVSPLPLLLVHCASTEPPPAAAPARVAIVVPLETAAATADPSAPELEDQGPAASPATTTPLFRPRSAVALPGSDNGSTFDGDRIVLFESAVDCDRAVSTEAPDGLSFQVLWVAGCSAQHSQFSMNNGVAKSYRLGIHVLSAPSKGVKGRVRIDPFPDGNVEGGELDVTWCE